MNEQKWLGQQKDGEMPVSYYNMVWIVVMVILTLSALKDIVK